MGQLFSSSKSCLKRPLLAVLICALLGTACTSELSNTEQTNPESLAFAERRNQTTTSTTLEDIPLGSAASPFGPLPQSPLPSAIRTSTGVVLPVIGDSAAGYQIRTPCFKKANFKGGEPIGRAHVVLDPGHGGHEFGSTGSAGTVEKELNLAVALHSKMLLEQAGATVALTREADYSLTLKSRAEIANKVRPALFISIHHNGGAPPGGDKPGTIVFTKSGSPEATRFGGLFYDELTPFLEAAGAAQKSQWQEYEKLRLDHEAAVMANEAAAQAQLEVLEENARRQAANMAVESRAIEAGTTSDQAVGQIVELLPIPELLPPPQPFDLEPVAPFSWAGSGNAGVRSWTSSDGEDFLGVIRHTKKVPSVLAEFLYLTNPAEEKLLLDKQFVEGQAEKLTNSIVRYFSTTDEGGGHVADQTGEQEIGGGGSIDSCIEPDIDLEK